MMFSLIIIFAAAIFLRFRHFFFYFSRFRRYFASLFFIFEVIFRRAYFAAFAATIFDFISSAAIFHVFAATLFCLRSLS